MKKISTVFCALFFIASGSAFAKTLPDEAAAKELTGRIMTKVAAGDFTAAFGLIKPYSLISPEEIDAIIAQAKDSRGKLEPRNGKAVGYEYIDSKNAGASLLRLRYIEKDERHAQLWEFYFYNTKEGWILDSFTWSDVYKPLFD